MALYLSLINSPDLILLDEPVAGLDDTSQQEFWQVLKEVKGSHTILVITHNLSPAHETADYCMVLHWGTFIHFSSITKLKELSKEHLVLHARRDPANV